MNSTGNLTCANDRTRLSEGDIVMKAGIIALVVLVLAAFLIGGSYVSSRNDMVRKNEAVKSQWSQGDVVLQRRADLIPNLVETVKGFAAQEQTVFHDIASARSALMGAKTPSDKIASTANFENACSLLIWIA